MGYGKTRLAPHWIPDSCREALRIDCGVNHGPPSVVPHRYMFPEQLVISEPFEFHIFPVRSYDCPHVAMP